MADVKRELIFIVDQKLLPKRRFFCLDNFLFRILDILTKKKKKALLFTKNLCTCQFQRFEQTLTRGKNKEKIKTMFFRMRELRGTSPFAVWFDITNKFVLMWGSHMSKGEGKIQASIILWACLRLIVYHSSAL